jgi:uncharacterized repeat protein (TIGR03899 family)
MGVTVCLFESGGLVVQIEDAGKNVGRSTVPLYNQQAMDIKDISGLGEPLAKLVEVVASGVGRVSRSFFIKRDADAKAYEIRKLAEALNESTKLLGDATYTKDGLTLTTPRQPEVLSASPQLEERALTRATYQEAKKQINIESITQHAAEELRDKETVSDEKVDEDWVSRFFSIAESISSEEMQTLWGKILAGEVTQPGSFSLRTLDTLKNLTKQDAEAFTKVAQAAFVDRWAKQTEVAFTLQYKGNRKVFEEEFSVMVEDIVLLKELGLMASPELFFYFYPTPEATTSCLLYGNKVILVEKKPHESGVRIPAEIFTRVGNELLSLVNITPKLKYVNELAKLIPKEFASVLIADLISANDEEIMYEGVDEIIPHTGES